MADRAAQARSSITRLLVGYLVVVGLFAGGFALASVLLVRAADRDRAMALIDADIADTMEKVGPPGAAQGARALAIVLARSTAPGDRLYRLSIGDRVIAGLDASVRFARDGAWWASGDPPALARALPLADGTTLLIGRRLVQGELTRRLLVAGTVALLLALAIAAIVGVAAGRRLRRRVGAINAACDRVRMGDLAARAPGSAGGDEFAALAAHVNDMLERIDTLVAGLRDVSNRIAHDLRTPVARLRHNLTIASDAASLDAARHMAGEAVAETDAILQTFEALLDIAEVEAGSTSGLAPLDPGDAVRDAIDLYESVADARGVTIRARLAPAQILGERMLLIRLVANLIDNAIKFSPQGGAVDVDLHEDGDQVILAVRDRGPGIAVDERERVLGRYARGEAARNVPGHGLGLALVTAVAKRHGARIAIDDAAPGLRFTVCFPRFGS
ncbi:HAMP domain-containing sensor histidine kinase [Sphingomonas baiyangensis]|uniref:histidine kinase n=1 Tax=Sphingomonas baiyangensis TaxID=2572576 RepID=A0A4U1L5M1_9SPHN|nr:HAMP domain-containing sensor histidine kinase [Sphingomonas baiyangensis]TKD51864.1 HAMP domain-containing histidine kinase [Sphingomonas baiyangensis]